MRDFDKNPYSADETRVAEYIMERTGIGGGDDPVGFIIASNSMFGQMKSKLAKAQSHLGKLRELYRAMQNAVVSNEGKMAVWNKDAEVVRALIDILSED